MSDDDRLAASLEGALRETIPVPAVITGMSWLEVRALTHTLFSQAEREIGKYSSLTGSWLWYALVYHSKAFNKLVLNHFVPVNAREPEVLRKRRDALFEWYDRKAEIGDILSFFDMVLVPSPSRALHWEPPVIGMTRTTAPNDAARSKLIYVGDILCPQVLDGYRRAIPIMPADRYQLVDSLLNTCTEVVLHSLRGRVSCRRIKQEFARRLDKYTIMRASDEALAKGLLCFLLKDNEWDCYYYFPSWEIPGSLFGAMAIATGAPLTEAQELLIRTKVAPSVFAFIGKIEGVLLSEFNNHERRFHSNLDRMCLGDAAGTQGILRDWIREAVRATPHVYAPPGVATETTPPGEAGNTVFYAPIERDGSPFLVVGAHRDYEHFSDPEIAKILEYLDHAGFRLHGALREEELPPAWLAFDVAGSTVMKKKFDSWRAWKSLRRFNEWAEDLLYRCNVVSFASTPDGYMCGFLSGVDATTAGLALIDGLKGLNEELARADAAWPILLRCGAHRGQVRSFDTQGTPVNKIIHEVLDHTGHLLKDAKMWDISFLISEACHTELPSPLQARFQLAGRSQDDLKIYQDREPASHAEQTILEVGSSRK